VALETRKYTELPPCSPAKVRKCYDLAHHLLWALAHIKTIDPYTLYLWKEVEGKLLVARDLLAAAEAISRQELNGAGLKHISALRGFVSSLLNSIGDRDRFIREYNWKIYEAELKCLFALAECVCEKIAEE
jgi:hypothetical protein